MQNVTLTKISILLEGLQSLPIERYPEEDQKEMLELMKELERYAVYVIESEEKSA